MLQTKSALKSPGWSPDILAPHIPANTGAVCCKKKSWSFPERGAGGAKAVQSFSKKNQFWGAEASLRMIWTVNLTCGWSLIMWMDLSLLTHSRTAATLEQKNLKLQKFLSLQEKLFTAWYVHCACSCDCKSIGHTSLSDNRLSRSLNTAKSTWMLNNSICLLQCMNNLRIECRKKAPVPRD